MKLLKRNLALLLSLLLCVGLITFSAFAEGTEEETPPASTETEQPVETVEEAGEQEPALKENEESEDEISDTELLPEEENEEPETLSVSIGKLADVRIENGSAVFAVNAFCNREGFEIAYQWQKLDVNGAFNEIEDAAERRLARESAWQDMDQKTTASLSFTNISDYSEYESFLFRCRVTAEDVVVYSDEVKLLPEIVLDDQTAETEPNAGADEPIDGEPDETDPTEDGPAIEDTPAEEPQQPVDGEDPVEEGEPQEAERTEEEEQQGEELVEDEGLQEGPETTEIILLEDFVWEGNLTVEEGFTVRVSGAAVVPEDVTLTVAGTMVMEEGASLTVAGRLVFAETAVTEGDLVAITTAETGEIEGLGRFLPEPEAEISTLNGEELLSTGVFDAEEAKLVAENVTIPADAILVLHGGELIIAPEATLTVEGLLIIDGGTLTVSEGATLKNDMFIQVEGAGTLTVEGTYAQSEMAALVWDAAENASIVEGIDKIMIDKTIFAADAEALSAILSRDGYRTLTVLLPDAELANTIDRVPNGVIISVR